MIPYFNTHRVPSEHSTMTDIAFTEDAWVLVLSHPQLKAKLP